jgi:hypothetical protein
MKFIVLLTLMASSAAFAGLGRTFTTSEDISPRSFGSADYKLDKSISVLVERVGLDTAEIYLDNNLKQIKVKKIGEEPGKKIYLGTLKIDVIAAGRFCDEKEVVVYQAKIEAEQFDEERLIYKAVEVKALHEYTYDICHDMGSWAEKEIIYNLTY